MADLRYVQYWNVPEEAMRKAKAKSLEWEENSKKHGLKNEWYGHLETGPVGEWLFEQWCKENLPPLSWKKKPSAWPPDKVDFLLYSSFGWMTVDVKTRTYGKEILSYMESHVKEEQLQREPHPDFYAFCFFSIKQKKGACVGRCSYKRFMREAREVEVGEMITPGNEALIPQRVMLIPDLDDMVLFNSLVDTGLHFAGPIRQADWDSI